MPLIVIQAIAGISIGLSALFGAYTLNQTNQTQPDPTLGTALRVLTVPQGGTGSSTLSGILRGNGTGAVQTVQIGANLSWDGTTLSGTGGGSGGDDPFTHPSAGVSATTSQMLITASTTIGDGMRTGGLTVNGGATTTGFFKVASSTNPDAPLFVAWPDGQVWTTNVTLDDGYGSVQATNDIYAGRDLKSDNLTGGGFVGSNTSGILYNFATSTIKISQLTNDAGFLTSALTSYDAWTHPSVGVSATSSGLIVTASSTFSKNFNISTSSALLSTNANGTVVATTSLNLPQYANGILPQSNGGWGVDISLLGTGIVSWNQSLAIPLIINSWSSMGTLLSGSLPYSEGGTGTSTPGAYGDVLAWNGSNWQGFSTSTLGLPTFADLYTDSDTNAYIHASSTIPKTYTANTWTNTNSIAASLLSITGLSDGCVNITSNILGSTGSPCGSGSGGSDPFTHPSPTVSATSSGMIFTASSTFSGNLNIATTSSLLATNANGTIVATTTISHTLLDTVEFFINGLSCSIGSSCALSLNDINNGWFPWMPHSWGNSTSTTLALNGGLIVNAASSTFAGGSGNATTTFEQGVKITATNNVSNSTSAGGILNLTNTLNDGAGAVFYTAHGAGATGRLASFRCNNTAFDQNCVNIDSNGAASSLNIVGANPSLGTIKVAAGSGYPSNNDSAHLSIDSSANSYNGQGIFLKHNAGTTTPALNIVDGSSNLMFKVDGNKLTTIVNASTTLLTAPDAWITKLRNLTSNGFVKVSGSDGTLSVDTNTYLTGNQTITLSGDVTGSGTTGITTTISSGAVDPAMLADADFGDWTCTTGTCLIDANAVALGTDTTGNYVATLTSSGSITYTGSGSESAAMTGNLNMANSNWWTARQNFTNASTSQLTASSSVWFTGVTASRPLYVDSNGLLGSAGSGTSGNCVQWGANNTLGDAGNPCGAGGGGSGNSPFATSTPYSGAMLIYPLTYAGVHGDFVLGGNSTTSASFIVDVSASTTYVGGYTNDTTLCGSCVYQTSSSASALFYGSSSPSFTGNFVQFVDSTATEKFAVDFAGNASTTGITATNGWFTNVFVGADTLSEYISDTTGAMVSGNTESGISVAYQDADNTLDFTVSAGPTNLAATDFGDFTCNGTTCSTDNGSIGIADLASVDFGSFTCNGSACTVDNDAIALATQTTGNYVATVSSSGSITVGNSGSENAAVTVNLNMGNTNTWTAKQNFAAMSASYATSTYASSTAFSTAYASSTLWYGGGLSSPCDSGNVLTWNSGRFGCATDQTGAGGGTFAWTPTTWGNSTSTVIGFLTGLFSNATTSLSGTTDINGTASSFLTVRQGTTNTEAMSIKGTYSAATDVLTLSSDGAFAGSNQCITWENTAGALDTASICSTNGASYTNSNLVLKVADSSKTLQSRLTVDVNGLLTFGNATSTAISTSYASSTVWRGGGLVTDCDADNQTLGWDITTGQFTCGDDDTTAGGGVDGFDFSYNQSLGYGITGSSTSTPVKFTTGILASSTSYFSNSTSTLLTATTAWITNLFIGATDIATYIGNAITSTVNLSFIQGLVSNDFHNLGGTDDDSPEAGDYAAASIDGDDINSNLAGRSLTLTAGSPDTLDADAELYTVYTRFTIASSTLDTAYNKLSSATTTWYVGNINGANTVVSIFCKTDTGTAHARIGDGTNWDDVPCNSSGGESTSLSNGAFTDRENIVVQIGTPGSSPNRVTFSAEHQLAD